MKCAKLSIWIPPNCESLQFARKTTTLGEEQVITLK